MRVLLNRGSGLNLPSDWLDVVRVSAMDDGGMGSLRFDPENFSAEKRRMGTQYAEVWFRDLDGVDVSASLNLDEDMSPFELDIWRTDFGRLISIPENLEDQVQGN